MNRPKPTSASLRKAIPRLYLLELPGELAESDASADAAAARIGGVSLPALCYYPACIQFARPYGDARCKECYRPYCETHLKLCGRCVQPICVSCLRDAIYDNVVTSYAMLGPASAQRTWLNVLTNVAACSRCTTACAACGVPGVANGRFACRACGRNVCQHCVCYSAGQGEMVCPACYGLAVRRDHEAASLLVSLRSAVV
jgi:hypothetical protein